VVVAAATAVGVLLAVAVAVTGGRTPREAFAAGEADLDPALRVVSGSELRSVEPVARCAGGGYRADLEVTGDPDEVLDRFERQLRRPRFDVPRRDRESDGTIHVIAGNVGDVQVDLWLGAGGPHRRLMIEACNQT
jgi:hypothetical protein